MRQSHLIVKEEGICIYRVPEKPIELNSPEWYRKYTESFDYANPNQEYQKDLAEWEQAVKQAQSSAILCEDQERATELAIKNGAYVCMEAGKPLLEIGSIYPVPGIEFEKIDACKCHPMCKYPFNEGACRQRNAGKSLARLIEHTAMTPFKKLTAYDESVRSITTDHTELIESPEIDKEEENTIIIDSNFTLSKELADVVYDKIEEIQKGHNITFSIRFAVDI